MHEAAPRPTRDRGVGQPEGPPVGQGDVVEAALAEALRGATAAGQWTVVAQLARELEARREARAGVVALDAERAKRGRTR
jgi:hypothetical protein